MKAPLRIASLLVAASISFAASSMAASINWGPGATTISGDNDVMATGTILAAYNFGAGTTGTTVINGVTFQNALSTDFDNYAPSVSIGSGVGSLTLAGSSLLSGNPFNTGGQPFASLSASYRSLLNSAVWNDFGSNHDITLTINNLTLGQLYRIQVWSNDSRGNGASRTTTFTAGNAVTLAQNTAANGGLGQFAVGTFVADAATQSILISTLGASSNLNGFTIAAVPEPHVTGVLIGAGALALAALRRRVRRA